MIRILFFGYLAACGVASHAFCTHTGWQHWWAHGSEGSEVRGGKSDIAGRLEEHGDFLPFSQCDLQGYLRNHVVIVINVQATSFIQPLPPQTVSMSKHFQACAKCFAIIRQ